MGDPVEPEFLKVPAELEDRARPCLLATAGITDLEAITDRAVITRMAGMAIGVWAL